MFELLTGASPFTLEGERNSQSEVSKWVSPAHRQTSNDFLHTSRYSQCAPTVFKLPTTVMNTYFPELKLLSVPGRRILRCEPPFPSIIGPLAQDLLRKLLVKDPHKRLGSGPRGSEEIKCHPFFKVLSAIPSFSFFDFQLFLLPHILSLFNAVVIILCSCNILFNDAPKIWKLMFDFIRKSFGGPKSLTKTVTFN